LGAWELLQRRHPIYYLPMHARQAFGLHRATKFPAPYGDMKGNRQRIMAWGVLGLRKSTSKKEKAFSV
jgi:hypothetical protein